MARLLLNGKLPSKEELMADDLVKQMVDEAKASGVTKESIIQALTVEDVPEPIKQALTKDVPTRETVLQALTADDAAALPEVVTQAVIANAQNIQIPPVVETFVKQMVSAAKGDQGGGSIAGEEGGKPKSALQKMREAEAEFRI